MPEYLITFNDEWVPEHTLEQLGAKSASVKVLIQEMKDAGVFVFTGGGLDASTAICSVDASSGKPVFTDGPFAETKEHIGGFAVVKVDGDESARMWAAKVAVACGWPQELHRFADPRWVDDAITQSKEA